MRAEPTPAGRWANVVDTATGQQIVTEVIIKTVSLIDALKRAHDSECDHAIERLTSAIRELRACAQLNMGRFPRLTP